MQIYSIGIQTSMPQHTNFKAKLQTKPMIKSCQQGADTVKTILHPNMDLVKTVKKEFVLKELSEEEFQAAKVKIINSANDFPSFSPISEDKINKWNVQLLDYMLNNPKDYKEGHYEIARGIAGWPSEVDNKNSAEVILKMLKMPWLFKSGSMEYVVSTLGYRASEKNAAYIKMKILDKLEKNEKDYSPLQMVHLKYLMEYAETKDSLRVANKLIENPKILEIRDISTDAFKGLMNKKKYADIKIDIIDKMASNPELLDNNDFIEHAHGFINNVVDETTKEFAFKILDNPIFFKSPSFAKHLNNMLYFYPKGKSGDDKNIREVMNNIIDASVKRPELFNNERFLKDFGDLLYVQHNADWIMLDERPIEIGKKNLFLIEHGYYS